MTWSSSKAATRRASGWWWSGCHAATCSRAATAAATTESLAANLDQLGVVVAPLPACDLFIVDRYLAGASFAGIGCLLIVNKCDLPPHDRGRVRAGRLPVRGRPGSRGVGALRPRHGCAAPAADGSSHTARRAIGSRQVDALQRALGRRVPGDPDVIDSDPGRPAHHRLLGHRHAAPGASSWTARVSATTRRRSCPYGTSSGVLPRSRRSPPGADSRTACTPVNPDAPCRVEWRPGRSMAVATRAIVDCSI